MTQMKVARSMPTSSVFSRGKVILERRRCRNSGSSGGMAVGYGGFTPSLCPGWLPLRVLDAVRCLGDELETLIRYPPSADKAAPVLAPVEAAKRFVDQLDLGLEHRLPRDIELARLGLARGIRRVLVRKRDVSATVTLRDRQALADAFDGRFEIRALAQEPLSHCRFVHRPPPCARIEGCCRPMSASGVPSCISWTCASPTSGTPGTSRAPSTSRSASSVRVWVRSLATAPSWPSAGAAAAAIARPGVYGRRASPRRTSTAA